LDKLKVKMWTQLVGAFFFVVITTGEATGLLRQSFGIQMGWIIYAFAAAVMIFEAWRTWKKIQTEPVTETETEAETEKN
jgi:hypothetical protein